MSFSSKYGYKKLRDEFQVDSMDDALRNSIWNAIQKLLKRTITNIESTIICDFFKEPIELKIYNWSLDTETEEKERIVNIQQKFYKLKWYEVYDFIEFIADIDILNKKNKHNDNVELLKEFKSSINIYLEREMSTYRLIENSIVRITNENEISSIEKALSIKGKKFEYIEVHFSSSLSLLSNRKNPDYRNSIKESISAVEACCRILTGTKTLGDALDKFDKSGIIIDNQLKAGFEKIYSYTNGKSTGIRHALMDAGNEPDFDDAMFMLVSCSAFVNYIISKNKKITGANTAQSTPAFGERALATR